MYGICGKIYVKIEIIVNKRITKIFKEIAAAESHAVFGTVDDQRGCSTKSISFDLSQLCVELDGGQHYEQEGRQHDEQRQAFLTSRGIHTMRFSNSDVLQNLEGALLQVAEVVKPLTPTPLPGGEGLGVQRIAMGSLSDVQAEMVKSGVRVAGSIMSE